MRLTDIMSGAGLAVYPQIALVIFLVVFAVVAVRVFRRGASEEMRRNATLPLEGEEQPGRGKGAGDER